MKIQIELQRPRWFVRSPRWAKVLVIATLALAVVAVPVAWASDRFTDVPNTNPHHDDINTIATAGITRGCNPPTNDRYCPGDNVRRDQMATFLQRGLGRAGRGHVSSSASTTEANIATVTLTVPGSGFVLVTSSTDIGCTCRLVTRLRHPVTGQASWYVGQIANGSDSGTTANTYLFTVSEGAHTFEVRGNTDTGTASTWTDVTALWVPFGSTGGSTLGASGDDTSARPGATGVNAGK